MYEVIFLWSLALIYILFAVIQDVRTKEIANWLNFSLIIFALGFRFFYSLFENNFSFFIQGAIGFAIFLVLGNLFYYTQIFAGGDAKLMISLGAVLPYSSNFSLNLVSFLDFVLIFLVIGLCYTLLASLFLCIKNFKSFKREFPIQFSKNKRIILIAFFLGLIFLSLGFFQSIFFIISFSLFLIPLSYLYSKTIDESCMIKKIKTEKLREGDWLYSDEKIGKFVIKSSWDGLTKEEIRKLRKNFKEVRIREGVQFSPVFLISFIIFVIFYFFNFHLWNPFW